MFEESYTSHIVEPKVEVARHWECGPHPECCCFLKALAVINYSGLIQGGERLGKISQKVVELEVFNTSVNVCLSVNVCVCVYISLASGRGACPQGWHLGQEVCTVVNISGFQVFRQTY